MQGGTAGEAVEWDNGTAAGEAGMSEELEEGCKAVTAAVAVPAD